jgi:hypothetical protein
MNREMTFSFFQWTCPKYASIPGVATGVLLIAFGALFMTGSLLRGLRVRGAFSRSVPGIRATSTHRAIFFVVGAAVLFEGAKIVFRCH